MDLRLANGLDPKLNFAQQKRISVVDGKQPFTVADITSARLETYDSLAKVYSLYVTLSNNPTLIEFGFLMNWPNLKPEEKRSAVLEVCLPRTALLPVPQGPGVLPHGRAAVREEQEGQAVPGSLAAGRRSEPPMPSPGTMPN